MDVLHSVHERLGEQMILVSIQCFSYNQDRELMAPRELRAAYASHCQVGYFPSMHVNNRPLSTPSAYSVGNRAEEAINKPPRVISSLAVELQADRRVKVTYTSKPNDGGISRPLRLLLWVVQDGMVGYQSRQSSDFVHNHVLRGSLNGVWGEDYRLGVTSEQVYSLPDLDQLYPPTGLRPTNRFNLDKCQVIAILLDAETKEFYDAVRLPLIAKP